MTHHWQCVPVAVVPGLSAQTRARGTPASPLQDASAGLQLHGIALQKNGRLSQCLQRFLFSPCGAFFWSVRTCRHSDEVGSRIDAREAQHL
jgi:hypothetical protein